MKRLAIVGASGHGLVVADTAQLCGWDIVDFFDDRWPEHAENGVWAIAGSIIMLRDRIDEYDGVVIAIGENRVRAQKQVLLREKGATFVSIVHPKANVSQYASVGGGSVVLAGAIVSAGATIGDGVILNTSCSVDHDCVIEDYVHISPGAHLGGNVSIGMHSWVGIGASVRHGINIGRDAIVGAGAAVVSDVISGHCVVGVPARPVSHRADAD